MPNATVTHVSDLFTALMELTNLIAEGVLEVLVGAGAEPVERHRETVDAQSGHAVRWWLAGSGTGWFAA
jgi:hypothetical protein